MLYVVYIAIDNDRNDEWFRYMRDEHLGDVLATGCFSDVTMARDFDADTAERTAYRIIYRAKSRSALRMPFCSGATSCFPAWVTGTWRVPALNRSKRMSREIRINRLICGSRWPATLALMVILTHRRASRAGSWN